MASPSGPHTSSPLPREQDRSWILGLGISNTCKEWGWVSETGALSTGSVPRGPAEEKRGVLLVLLGGQAVKRACSSGDDSLLERGGQGQWCWRETAPGCCPLLPPQIPAQDEAAQRSCAGLLSYYTWATPVTVKATPSAVSTSSQRGCNVIISREILPRNAKQGHRSGGLGPRVRGESNTSLLRLGLARDLVAEEGGEDSPGVKAGSVCEGDGWENKARWCRWLQGKECECATQVYTRPLLKPAWLEEWEKAAEKCLWWSWLVAGWEESRRSCVCIS